jgi:hypothetical protein
MALLILSKVVMYYFIGLSQAYFTEFLGAKTNPVEWFGLAVAGSLVNFLTPVGGGAMVRSGYLKLRYKLPISRFSSLFAVTLLMNYLAGGIAGLALIVIFLLINTPVPALAIAIITGLIVVPLIILSIPLERLPLPNIQQLQRARRIAMSALDGWKELRTAPSLLVIQFFLILALILVQAVGIHLGLASLGQPVDFLNTLFLGIMLGAWRVTPAPIIGAGEVVAMVIAPAAGITPAQALVAAVLARFANWVVMFTLGPVFSYLLSRRLGQPLASAAQIDNTQREQAGS